MRNNHNPDSTRFLGFLYVPLSVNPVTQHLYHVSVLPQISSKMAGS